MVRIAIAGGSGQVAREVIDALLATAHHEIVILSRRVALESEDLIGTTWRVVDYDDECDLAEALRGTHTVLSFLQIFMDPESKSQKQLIDAAITAGVKRFAPSEYGSASTINMPWWAGKESIRRYLEEINKHGKYTLFQAGLFLDYLAFPYKTSRHVDPLQTFFDFQNCRAIVVNGFEDTIMTFTSASDLANVIALAVNEDREWPKIGGIRGNHMTVSEVIQLGEIVRGRPFVIERVKLEDLEAGKLVTSWSLEKKHHVVSEQGTQDVIKTISIGMLISSTKGAWNVSDNFNLLFPTYKFESAREFLGKVWQGKIR